MKSVEQVMTTDVATVDAGKTVSDAIALMLDHDISVLPVVNEKRLVGLITMRDLLRTLPYRPVVDVMQRDVATASASMPITSAYVLMEEQRVGQLPVVDQDRVVGLITREGILRELGLPIDPLTELPWAAALRERAVNYLKDGLEVAIIFFDLDNFGQVNKQSGHVAGDRYIEAVAEALLVTIDPSQDLLCRYAGDEFAILTTRRRDDAEAMGQRALEAIGAVRPPGAAPDFTLTASMGIAGGKRTTEREDVHFEATVDDLITIASRQTTRAKVEKSGRNPLGVEGPAAEPRLHLQRVGLSTVYGEVTATVELSLGPNRHLGEVKGPGLGMAPWRLLAYAAVQAVHQILPDGWKAAIGEVRVIPTSAGSLVAVTLYLGSAEGTPDRYAGCVLVDGDVGPAVVKATLQAVNRRLGRLLQRGGRSHGNLQGNQ
jgi:diguanylate cyclase (GGDEF)-like protein